MLLFAPRHTIDIIAFILLLFLCLRGEEDGGVVLLVRSEVINCTSSAHCEDSVGKGSQCQSNGVCSNGTTVVSSSSFQGGCLRGRLDGWTKKRVCNSEDPLEAERLGLCRKGDFDYVEIRIASQNWESVFFQAFLLQILLSELLDVPTTIETGTPNASLNFYDPNMPFEYGVTNDYDALELAAKLRDCRKASRDPQHYQSCAHLVPEDWEAHNNWVKERVRNGLFEPPRGLAIVGQESWFVPKFTMTRDPSLGTYLGLRGEHNRPKIANTFLRPTRWGEYCDSISPDRCASPGGRVARRRPINDNERDAFFAPDLYTGYFRKTAENDCERYPSTCTGHIVDYPCGWSSYTQQIAKHLGIALVSNGNEPGSGGYKYSEMLQIIKASNATKSDIIVQWWTPETLYSQLLGTDAELQRVALPPTTQACVKARVNVSDRCSFNATLRTGSPLGVCDEPSHPLVKIVSSGLYDAVHYDFDNDDPSSKVVMDAGSRSPAYDAITLWSIDNLQLGEIFEYWNARKQQSRGTPAGRSAREAVCDWAVDNMAFFDDFIPRDYPRVLRKKNVSSLQFASIAIAGVASLTVCWTWWMVFRQRKRRIMRVAQIEFLWLVLAGLLIHAIGAMFSLFTTDSACVAAMWLVNFGYTLELVPLIVKVAAINRLMHAAEQMRRVVLRRKSLFEAVAVINGIVVLLLVVWNVMDAPVRTPEYDLLKTTTKQEETIVTISFYCSSKFNTWRYILVSVNAVLLLWATILAFQSSRLRQDFNESITLAFMIYSHAVFLVLTLITFFLEGSVSNSILQHCQSVIYSVDTVATVVIYFLPKFATSDEAYRESMQGYHVYFRRFIQSRSWVSDVEPTANNSIALARNSRNGDEVVVESTRNVCDAADGAECNVSDNDDERSEACLEFQEGMKPLRESTRTITENSGHALSSVDAAQTAVDWTKDDDGSKESAQTSVSTAATREDESPPTTQCRDAAAGESKGTEYLETIRAERDRAQHHLETLVMRSCVDRGQQREGESSSSSLSDLMATLRAEVQRQGEELQRQDAALRGKDAELQRKDRELEALRSELDRCLRNKKSLSARW